MTRNGFCRVLRRTLGDRLALRYVMAGGFNTLVSYGVYGAAILGGVSVQLSSLLAIVIGVLLGFATHGGLVFRRLSLAAFARFLAAWATMYMVFLGSVFTLGKFGIGPLLGGALATAVNTCVSFFVLRDLVFRPLTD